MNYQEFSASINPLLSRFKNAYNGDVLSLVFDEVKSLTLLDFKRLVAHLNGSLRFAPMVPDFKKGVEELRLIRPNHLVIVSPTYRPEQREDLIYQIRDNIWADNAYIFIRSVDGARSSFILKADHPEHPLVMEDKEVRNQRIAEAKKHLASNTYKGFMDQKLRPIKSLKPLSFETMEGT